jgi:hypothetical protein
MNGLKLSQLKQVTENTIQFLKCMNIILLLKKVAYNVIRLCAGGALKHESINPPLNLIKRTNDEYNRQPPLAQNRCYTLARLIKR